jgi:hypothetical protein
MLWGTYPCRCMPPCQLVHHLTRKVVAVPLQQMVLVAFEILYSTGPETLCHQCKTLCRECIVTWRALLSCCCLLLLRPSMALSSTLTTLSREHKCTHLPQLEDKLLHFLLTQVCVSYVDGLSEHHCSHSVRVKQCIMPPASKTGWAAPAALPNVLLNTMCPAAHPAPVHPVG